MYGIICFVAALGVGGAIILNPAGITDGTDNLPPVVDLPESGSLIAIDDDDTNMETKGSTMPPLPESGALAVRVGVLIPATGDLASHGSDTKHGLEMALDHFNEYLIDKQSNWHMQLVIEDTQTDPIIALEKIQSFDSKGIKYVLGPSSSSELRNIMAYADSGNMLLISPSSSSPKLSIAGDGLFRMIPNDTDQGKVISALLESLGIRSVVILYRGDIWGDGLHDTVKAGFEADGGVVAKGLRYSPEATTFSAEVDVLSRLVGDLRSEYGHDAVGIVLLSFDEASHIFNSATEYENLRDTRWIGSGGITGSHGITGDLRAAEFAEFVGLLTLQFAASDNAVFKSVRDEFVARTGSTPGNNYVYSAYESLWVLGLAMDAARIGSVSAACAEDVLSQSCHDYYEDVSVQDVMDHLPAAVMDRTGVLGSVEFDEYGDLLTADYEFLTVHDAQWIPAVRYDASTGIIITHQR